MAVSGYILDSALRDEATGDLLYSSGTFYVMLCTNIASPTKSTWTRRSDVTNEVVGTGYVANGAQATVTVGATDTVNNRVDITLGGVQWASSTLTARYAVYYNAKGGTAANDPLVAIIDFGADVSTIAATFTISASTLRKQN